MVECSSTVIVIEAISVPKPTRAFLLFPWERHFPLLGGFTSSSKFQQYLYKTKKKTNEKFQTDSNISASSEAGRCNCLAYV